MIKSPLRPAMTQPLTSPYELITRSVFELNGTQWGELSDQIVLPNVFELEIFFSSALESAQRLVANNETDFSLHLNGTAKPSVKLTAGNGDISYITLADTVNDGKARSIIFKRNGDTFTLTSEYETLVRVFEDIGTLTIDGVLGVESSNQRLIGIAFGLKIWTNGDRNTGDLILNVPFDESGSDYQRNRAVALGVSLLPATSIADGTGWASTSVEFDNALIFENEDNFAGANYDIGYSYSTTYEIEFEIFDYVSGNLQATFEGVGSENKAGNGIYKVYLKSPAAGLTRFSLRARNGVGEGTFKVRNISIRGWSGVILQNALPEHWLQIERKRYWDYWLKPNFWDAANVITTGACTATGNSIEFSMTNTTLAGARLPGIEDSHVYQISGYSDVVGVINPTQSTGFADNIAVPLENRFVYDSTGVGLTLGIKRQQGEIVTGQVRDITVREKLEIAQ